MSPPPFSRLRRLHRALVYSSLDFLVGRSVPVNSAETVFDDVIESLRGDVRAVVRTREPDLSYRVGAIAKYGILDLTFGLEASDLAIDRPGVGVLRDLGLVDAEADHELSGPGGGFLDDLLREAEGGDLFLKLFLDTPKRAAFAAGRLGAFNAIPATFWPAPFVVRDACLTNARSIWLSKHLYL